LTPKQKKQKMSFVKAELFPLELDPEKKAKQEAELNKLRAALAYDMQIRSNNATYFDKLHELLPKLPIKEKE
jgi:hypothetical protein